LEQLLNENNVLNLTFETVKQVSVNGGAKISVVRREMEALVDTKYQNQSSSFRQLIAKAFAPTDKVILNKIVSCLNNTKHAVHEFCAGFSYLEQNKLIDTQNVYVIKDLALCSEEFPNKGKQVLDKIKQYGSSWTNTLCRSGAAAAVLDKYKNNFDNAELIKALIMLSNIALHHDIAKSLIATTLYFKCNRIASNDDRERCYDNEFSSDKSEEIYKEFRTLNTGIDVYSGDVGRQNIAKYDTDGNNINFGEDNSVYDQFNGIVLADNKVAYGINDEQTLYNLQAYLRSSSQEEALSLLQSFYNRLDVSKMQLAACHNLLSKIGVPKNYKFSNNELENVMKLANNNMNQSQKSGLLNFLQKLAQRLESISFVPNQTVNARPSGAFNSRLNEIANFNDIRGSDKSSISQYEELKNTTDMLRQIRFPMGNVLSNPNLSNRTALVGPYGVLPMYHPGHGPKIMSGTYGPINNPIALQLGGRQLGGSTNDVQSSLLSVKCSNVFRNLYTQITAKLNANRKHLSKDNIDAIEQLLSHMTDTEGKLHDMYNGLYNLLNKHHNEPFADRFVTGPMLKHYMNKSYNDKSNGDGNGINSYVNKIKDLHPQLLQLYDSLLDAFNKINVKSGL